MSNLLDPDYWVTVWNKLIDPGFWVAVWSKLIDPDFWLIAWKTFSAPEVAIPLIPLLLIALYLGVKIKGAIEAPQEAVRDRSATQRLGHECRCRNADDGEAVLRQRRTTALLHQGRTECGIIHDSIDNDTMTPPPGRHVPLLTELSFTALVTPWLHRVNEPSDEPATPKT